MNQRLVPNIGPRERRKRLTLGILALVVGAGLTALLVATGAARAWRLLAAPPLWGAALGYFQARDRT